MNYTCNVRESFEWYLYRFYTITKCKQALNSQTKLTKPIERFKGDDWTGDALHYVCQMIPYDSPNIKYIPNQHRTFRHKITLQFHAVDNTHDIKCRPGTWNAFACICICFFVWIYIYMCDVFLLLFSVWHGMEEARETPPALYVYM